MEYIPLNQTPWLPGSRSTSWLDYPPCPLCNAPRGHPCTHLNALPTSRTRPTGSILRRPHSERKKLVPPPFLCKTHNRYESPSGQVSKKGVSQLRPFIHCPNPTCWHYFYSLEDVWQGWVELRNKGWLEIALAIPEHKDCIVCPYCLKDFWDD